MLKQKQHYEDRLREEYELTNESAQQVKLLQQELAGAEESLLECQGFKTSHDQTCAHYEEQLREKDSVLEFVSVEISKIKEQQAADQKLLEGKDAQCQELSTLLQERQQQVKEQTEEIVVLLDTVEKARMAC